MTTATQVPPVQQKKNEYVYSIQDINSEGWERIPTRDAYGRALEKLGGEDSRIVALDADLSGSTRTGWFGKKYPDRFFNVGIAEQNMIGIAAGQALAGRVPFVSTFAIFLTGRAWEPIRQSICYPKLNVKLVASHSGLTVGEDGASHQALEDVTLMRVLPNMQVWIPADGVQTRKMIAQAVQPENDGPMYIRTSRPASPIVYKEDYVFDPQKPDLLIAGEDIVLITNGLLVREALQACEHLQDQGFYPALINLPVVKPLPEQALSEMLRGYKAIVTFEEHSVHGGLGSAIAEFSASHMCKPVHIFGTRTFGKSGKPDNLLRNFKLDAAGMEESLRAIYKNL